MIILEDRILLHLQDGKRIPVDPQEIYLLKAEGYWVPGTHLHNCSDATFSLFFNYVAPDPVLAL